MKIRFELLAIKKYFIVSSAILIGLLHLIPLSTNTRFYPLEKYDMFSKIKRRPLFRSLYLYVLDGQKRERPAPRGLFAPYNRRGLHASISQLIPNIGVNSVLEDLLVFARNRNPRIYGLRLYDAECSCEEFASADLSVEVFVTEKCKKTLVADVYVQ